MHRIIFKPAAQRQLAKLPRNVGERIARAIDALSDQPRPSGCKKLAGPDDLWRIRVGDYRIVYQIDDDRLVVLVTTIGHRREVYD
jgi:mRNA interferase RelE/StbE